MTDLRPWGKLLAWTLEGRPCVLLMVADTEGSGPGSAGSVMAVAEDESVGTVGGGSMEEKLIERSMEKLRAGDLAPEPLVHRHIQDVDGSSGMICSGSQTTLIIPVTPPVAAAVRDIRAMLDRGSHGILEITESSFTVEDGEVPQDHGFTKRDPGWKYAGPLGVIDTVYIIGGGHVGRALAALLPGLSFRPVVIDCRESTFLPDPPDCRWIVSPYGRAREHIDQGEHSWAVIMTPEHRADSEVLGSLSGMTLRYVGMMASGAKRAAVYRELLQKGVPSGFLEGVHSPIGLPIGSRTPKEIAVSIAAELIGIRSGITFRSPGSILR